MVPKIEAISVIPQVYDQQIKCSDGDFARRNLAECVSVHAVGKFCGNH